MNKIKLSICIPTWNRVEKLRMMLDCIYSEYNECKDEIQICISDNGTAAVTAPLVREYQEKMNIDYYAFEEEIHPYRNWSNAAVKMPKGEYVWLLGDDDLLINHAIRRVLTMVEEHPSDYYYLNHLNKPFQQLMEIETCKYEFEVRWEECECFDMTSHYVDKWEEILNYPGRFQDVNMLYIGNHIFRKGWWKYDSDVYDRMWIPQSFDEDSLDQWYSVWSPQLFNLVTENMGKRCYYYGEPCVVQGTGVNIDEEFSIRFLAFLPRWVLLFQQYGMDEKEYKKYLVSMDRIALARIRRMLRYHKDWLRVHPYCLAYFKERCMEDVFLVSLLEESDDEKSYIGKLQSNVFEDKLEELMKQKDGLLAIWGTGDVAANYLQGSNVLREYVDYVVDGNDRKQKKQYELLDITIEAPSTLAEKKVFCIVVCSIKYESDIMQWIRGHMKNSLYVLNSKGIQYINNEKSGDERE